MARARARLFDRVSWIVAGVAIIVAIFAYARGWLDLSPTTLTGRALVADGDSLTISGSKIRLQGIDAPEAGQTCTDAKGEAWACGAAAARALRGRVQGQTLTCKAVDVDQYDRFLALCTLPDGSDLNAWMVREGWAVSYGFAGFYGPEQDEAEANKRGLWAGTFTRPSQWRKVGHD
jgi:endonuclease YncB( thermonuclease family)